jgi:nucleoside-diphosphate-sugar epimerase
VIDSLTEGHVHATSSASPDRGVMVVTGASGFIGRYVCRVLLERGWRVRGSVRAASRAADLEHSVEAVPWDLEREEAPAELVAGARAIIHLAGRAHRMGRQRADEVALYRRINVDATRSLVAAARSANVRRFVFVSTVKVMGEGDASPYAADSALDPRDAYATSKADAERVVREEAGALRWTIVRPTFVYGASGKGNFVRLMTLARLASRVPLPLGGLRNRRSLVYVENLADLLVFCAESEQTAGRILPGVDIQAISTPALLRAVSASLGLTPRLFSAPDRLLAVLSCVVGRSADWQRLSSDFEVETSILREVGWRPPISFDESFRRSARLGRAREAV